jgi:hypothetical protein
MNPLRTVVNSHVQCRRALSRFAQLHFNIPNIPATQKELQRETFCHPYAVFRLLVAK